MWWSVGAGLTCRFATSEKLFITLGAPQINRTLYCTRIVSRSFDVKEISEARVASEDQFLRSNSARLILGVWQENN
jgi:hypothetical protein